MYNLKIVQDQSEQRIYNFLKQVNKDFKPELESRVILADYSKKLAVRAINIFAYTPEEDLGHAAFYANDLIEREAFLSSISVKLKARGTGASSALLEEVIRICKSFNMNAVALEVDPDNTVAISFYRKHGFEFTDHPGAKRMKIIIK